MGKGISTLEGGVAILKTMDYPAEIINNKKKLIEKADKIIAISEHTKNDILRFNEIDPSKIEVIYHATSIKLPVN